MNITLTGKKITQDERILAFKKDNLTAQMTFTVDTDDSWVYKLDVRLPVKCCTGEELFNIIDLPMDANRTCTIDVTAAMVPLTGKYTMQLRGISGEQVYHSDTFEVWVKYSIDPGAVYDPVPSEFYQIEQNVTEMNNHPPKPGQNGYWLVWDITTSQYKESDIPLLDGMLPEVTADTSGKYLSNDGKKAYWAEVQTGTESKIDKIEVNGVEQPIVDKTVNIAVPTKTSDLSNDSGYITNEALDGYAKTDDIPTKTSQLNNDANYITAAQAPVQSVNNKTGAVTLSAADVSAIPSTLTGTAGQVLTKTADGQEWKDVDIPTQLPNPNALTFTGAVTGSYDGSAPLSVEIPSGGGSGGSAALHLLAEGTLTEDAASIDVNGFSADRIAFAVAPYGSTANSGNVNGLFTFGFSDDSSINSNINMVFVDNKAVKAWNKHIFYATVNGNVLDILAARDTGTWNTDINIKISSNFAGALIRRVILPKTVKITSLSIGLASTGVIGANTQFKVVCA